MNRGSNRPGWIYIVGVEASFAAKIGFAQNPRGRLATMQTDNHEPLRLLYLKMGTAADERVLLTRFAALKLHGSWFRCLPGNELSRFLGEEIRDPFHIIDIEECWDPAGEADAREASAE